MKTKLTKRTVDALKASGVTSSGNAARLVVYDTELSGFGVRVTPAGTKTFFVDYRPGAGGRGAAKVRHVIGQYGAPWTVDTARKEADRLLHAVKAGADPARAKSEARHGPEVDDTFAALAERFLNANGRSLRRRGFGPKAARDYRSIIEGKLVPAWGARSVDDITKRDVERLVDGIAADHPAMARLTFACVRSLLAWAADKGIIEGSPLLGVKAPPPAKRRQRVLTDDELRLLWVATAGGGVYDRAVRLLLLTGARREEVAAARWGELETSSAVWRIDGDRTKNAEPHEVDLAPLAQAEIEALTRRQREALTKPDGAEPSDRDLAVFRHNVEPHWFGRRPLANWSAYKARLDNKLGELAEAEGREPIRPWVVHDLRRTCATGMQRLGIGVEVVERCLNHTSGTRGGLVGTYQTDDLRERRKAAHEAWAAHVERIVSGAANNVVPLPRVAGEGRNGVISLCRG